MLYHLVLGLCLVRPQVAPALPEPGPMELSPEIRQFLDQKVDRNLPQMERLQALVSAVFRSNDLHFVYHAATRTAAETFRERSGNCLSFTILFISMARYLGLDARFREVEIPPVWSKSGNFVNLSQHVNAAVFIGGQAFAIDVFPGVNPIEVGGQVVSDARGLAHYYNNKGVDELGKGYIQAGESFLKKALDADPTTVNVWVNLGAAKAQSGNFKAAEKDYRKALELEPKNLAAMSNLANVCELTGREKEAQRLRNKVREFMARNPYHQYNLGLRAFDEGNYQGAVEHYRRAIRLKAAEHNFYFALARAYGMLGQKTEAVANLQLAEKYALDTANKQRYAEKLELLKSAR
jgi:Flp pilus assembly protein TadD